MAERIEQWLERNGLGKYAERFALHDVTLEALPHLTLEDLKELGLPLGPRRILQAAIARLDAGRAEPAASAVSEEAASVQREAERRQLTVMFVDLVGSTALSQRLDPEEMREVIRAYQNAVAGEISRFGGYTAKLMGDGVLAYFGWPQAHEDDAERAVRAGLAVISAVGRLPATGGEALSARVGIATGLVVVGDLVGEGAAQEQAVVGDTPNLAARLQAIAEPGMVAIAETTRRLLGDLFDLRDLGELNLKGMTESVNAFSVLGERAVESRFAARQAGEVAPIVGRDQELALLLDRWRQARGGEGQMMLLTGEAGIGKSRLTEAMVQAVGGDPHYLLRYQCSPYHGDSALYPVIQQLQHAMGTTASDDRDRRLPRLEALLAQAVDDISEAAPLVAGLLGLDGAARYGTLDLTPQQRRNRTLAVLVDQIVGLARRRPVLWVVEDAHWIDPTTLEWIELALDRVTNSSALLLMTARPTFVAPFASHPVVTRLALNRLARAATQAIVERITLGKRLPEILVNEISARTDGVPLFVEEMTKAVIESGVLREDADGFHLDGPLSRLSIPTTLHDSLMARLDRLQPVKEVAQTAAVIGRNFDHQTIAALSALPEAELNAAMNRLVEAELIFRRGTPPDATYLFKHALVRDAAYESLLRAKRVALHARLLEVLEAAGETSPEVKAQHAEAAGLHEQALHYWERAGALALERSANVEAVAHFRAGLAVLKHLDEDSRARCELPLQTGLGSALTSVKGYTDPESRAAYQRARDICLDLGDKERLLPVLYGLWNFDLVAGNYHEARQVARQLVKLAEQHGASGPLVAAYSALSFTSMFIGSLADGSRYAQAAIKLYDPKLHAALKFEGGDDPCVQAGLSNAMCLWSLGHPDTALRAMGQAVELAEKLQHANSKGYALSMNAMLHCTIGNVQAAAVTGQAGIEFARATHLPIWERYSMAWHGWALACMGNATEGIAELHAGMDGWHAAGSKAGTSSMLAALGDACRAAGRFEEAMRAVDRGIQYVAETGEGMGEAELHRLKGVLLLRMKEGEPSQGETWLLRALEIARRQESRSMELRIATDLARLWQSQGKAGEARDLLAPIRGWFTEGFDTPNLKDAKALLEALN